MGYLLLGLAIEARVGATLDEVVATEVTRPLGIADRVGSARQLAARDRDFMECVAPTEEIAFRGGVVRGVVHDENSWAINGDALDLGSGSEIPGVFAARQKASVRFIAVVREDLNNQVTLARKDTPIRTITDLKGKRVGYVRATTAHYFLQKQLAEAGLSFQDIQAINLTPADGLSAFDRGDLDAWAIYGYNGQLARTRYGARVLKTGKGYLSGNFPIYANPKSIADPLRHAAITDYLLRLRKAYAWANPNYLAYARAQSAETRVPVGDLIELFNNRSDDYALRAVDARVIGGHQDVADTFTKIGVLDGPADVAPLWDRSFDAALRVGSSSPAG